MFNYVLLLRPTNTRFLKKNEKKLKIVALKVAIVIWIRYLYFVGEGVITTTTFVL
jgi:hypothetical protein